MSSLPLPSHYAQLVYVGSRPKPNNCCCEPPPNEFDVEHTPNLKLWLTKRNLTCGFFGSLILGLAPPKPPVIMESRKMSFKEVGAYIPYVPPSSAHFQIGIWSTKRQLFNWQFCVSLHHTICKQWAKGFCEILKFWPLHSVRQNIAGFRRGLFTCFLGHTPLLQYNLLFGPHFCIRGVAQKAGK